MKYIDAERLKAEIDNLESFSCISEEQDGFYSAISRINGIIDSLQQEQPEVDFKIEERKWVHDAVDNIFPEDGDFMSEVDFRKILKDTARHFYELGKSCK